LEETGARVSGAPLQQFSVRKLSNAFMVSNFAASMIGRPSLWAATNPATRRRSK
jgi:hypothetical protein